MLNIIYIQLLQESKDNIGNQPCMIAYLSFVTVFNIVYQRKTGFQKPILFIKNARECVYVYIHKTHMFIT